MSQPSTDAKAVVKALAALTTQVGRIADALTTPVVEHVDGEETTPIYCPLCPEAPLLLNPADATDHFRVQHPEQRLNASGAWPLLVPDDGSTTPATTTAADGPRCVCGDPIQLSDPIDPDSWIHSPGSDTPCLDARRACDERGPWGDAHACIRQAGHPDDHEALDGCGWRTGFCGSGQHKPHPGFTCAEVDASQSYFRVRWEQEQQAPAEPDDATCRRMETRTCPLSYNGPCGGPCARFESNDPTPWTDTAEAPAADEGQTLRWTRRESLLVLLTRLQRGRPLTAEEAGTLRHHVETEIREADTARRETATADRIRAEAQRDRDQHAAVLREVLAAFTHETHPGRRCLQSGHINIETVERWRSVVAPTVERPWWEQVALYENEAIEATKHVLELKATIERVRAVCMTKLSLENAKHVYAALDGTEQPTTED